MIGFNGFIRRGFRPLADRDAITCQAHSALRGRNQNTTLFFPGLTLPPSTTSCHFLSEFSPPNPITIIPCHSISELSPQPYHHHSLSLPPPSLTNTPSSSRGTSPSPQLTQITPPLLSLPLLTQHSTPGCPPSHPSIALPPQGYFKNFIF
ncbi:hypothetical protein Pcinc_023098 [Petrolisthes cinctipes]|uniref:Uncharacterized protein n=1 Tax=Petrolisthes cinctipes TaxID=88211 RepID=A0AAE1FE84_PETCI|nr:hypothetical protein Pcinc_023098 [Petrolisthes cinctipes]